MNPNKIEMNQIQGNTIILFDGECGFCNAGIRFIYRKDKLKKFKFCSLQSITGQYILKQFGFSTSVFNTLILFEGGKIYTKSTAVLRIAGKLKSFVSVFSVFIVFPIFIRDNIYDLIAKNRKKFLAKKIICEFPDEHFIERII
jgi:predicted DCC family thiol-disulfide oxidoreductase YuxK